MSLIENYTEYARRYTFKHPVLSFVGLQIMFWVFANFFLGLLIQIQVSVINEVFPLPRITSFPIILVVGVAFGFFYGTVLGLCDYYLENIFSKKQSLGKVIIVKTGISISVLIILLTLIRYIFLYSDLSSFFNTSALKQNDKFWFLIAFLFAVYYFIMSVLMSYINQVNKKFGPGVLVPLLLGKYKNPKKEIKIFMFMDLNASTTIAEKLGHIKYSEFIRDSFLDIDSVIPSSGAEIYQYVGDEIVLTWPFQESENNLSCLSFYFECENRLQGKKDLYLEKYGILPSFKAGLHLGEVTAVEIGNIKREIAYHGDTVNTAARILSLCNEYQKKILVSNSIINYFIDNGGYLIEPLGKIKLRGKTEEVEIASVQPVL